MAIDKLTASLLADAKKEADEIVRTAEWHVNKMITEEKARKVVLMKAAEDEIAKRIKEHEKERIAWARLEAKRIIAEAREDAIKATFEDFFSLLTDVRKSRIYGEFMKRILNNALKEIDKGDATVHVVKGDRKFINGFKGKVVEDLDCMGGLIVETNNGKVRVNMTLESLFETKRDVLRKSIYEGLFGTTDRKTKEKSGESQEKKKTKR